MSSGSTQLILSIQILYNYYLINIKIIRFNIETFFILERRRYTITNLTYIRSIKNI